MNIREQKHSPGVDMDEGGRDGRRGGRRRSKSGECVQKRDRGSDSPLGSSEEKKKKGGKTGEIE